MQFKKLFKYLPIAVIAASLVVPTSTSHYSINNSDYFKEQISNTDQEVNDVKYNDQLEYIRNDIKKQTNIANSVTSIKFADSISSYSSAALVTKTDGSTLLYMWGYNGYGQLGNGSKDDTFTPTLVNTTAFGSKKITQIALGESHSAALLADGSLYTWGNNRFGQLGTGTSGGSASTPTPVTNPNGRKITQIALGESHSFATLEDNTLYTWGANNSGQLGNEKNIGTWDPNPNPTPVAELDGKKIEQIALGNSHSAVRLADGSLYMWGSNLHGQLGNTKNSGTTNANPVPTVVPATNFGFEKITQIAVGQRHSAALTKDGNLYMWGANNYGQLGFPANGDTPNTIPFRLTKNFTSKIDQIVLGQYDSAALLANGSLYMWGGNYYGQLGDGTTDHTPTPTKVTALNGKKITQICVSDYTAAALDDGSIYMWGLNNYGQLGHDYTSDINPTPIWMSQLGAPSKITANPTLSAKEAVDKFWVNNSFDLNGFKSSFNLISIPINNEQEITMDAGTPPSYDIDVGTVTINVSIKYYYNEDWLPAPDTTTKEMIITGFLLPFTEDQNRFPWEWILISAGAAVIVGAAILLAIIERREAGA